MRDERGKATTGDANALVEQHLYLVQHIVHELAARYPRHVDRGELWSAGAAGLVEAAHRYDPHTGVPFARYASIRIRGAIIDSTRSRDWASRRLRREMRALEERSRSFEETRGRTPDEGELARELGITPEEVAQRRAAAATATLLHLDHVVGDGDGGDVGTLGENVPERDTDWVPEAALEQQELVGTVRTAIACLSDVQREVVERYFFGGEYLRDIAHSLGVTEARVSQIRAEALNAIRAYFGSAFEAVPEVPASAPGVRSRAAYVSAVSAQSTWRSRIDAGKADGLPNLAAV